MTEKIRLGISSCLLGLKVRYDGGHKLDHCLKETLGRYVEWMPVCPEVESGLPVPREAMRLIGTPEAPRLLTLKTGVDYTEKIQNWAEKRLGELELEDLCGFVFKSGSPSSGMKGVEVYSKSGVPVKSGTGIFARAFMERFPFMPVEDEVRLKDPVLRKSFIERVFVFQRRKELTRQGAPAKDLVEIHTDFKLWC